MQKLLSFLFAVILCVCTVSSQPNLIAQTTLSATDYDVLLFAFTLETLEASFYNKFQAIYNNASFVNAGYGPLVYSYFNYIQQHENTHVAFLQTVINTITGSSVNISQCVFNFDSITNIYQYVGAARLFENTGVQAYDGAINALSNPTYQQAAATIATVEGRHAAYLNQLNGTYGTSVPGSPFPANVDTAVPAATIGAAVNAFITSCSAYNLNAAIAGITVVPVQAILDAHLIGNPSQASLTANDLNVLQFALTLELLEATYYNNYLNNASITVNTFTAAGLTATDYAYFQMIQAHENSHVTLLQQTITNTFKATPVQPCTYNFGSAYSSVVNFVTTAKNLENTGVTAYDGAVNTITNPGVKQVAATIATVEARHASYLNQIQFNVPFPAAFDTAATPTSVIAAIQPFVSNCPALTLPVLLQFFGANVTNNVTSATTAAAFAATATTSGASNNATTATSTTGGAGQTSGTSGTSTSGTSTSGTSTSGTSTTSRVTSTTSSAARDVAILAALALAAICAVLL